MESKKINQLATELAPELSDLTIIGDPTTGISKKITLSQMASLFTGTVEEYANLASFPLVGAADTIYIALDTNIIYRWNTSTSAYVELSPNIVTSLVFNDANGFDGTISLVGSTATLTITTALTTGSVGFIGASGALLQDNANFFWDNSNKRLGINTNAPTTALDVFGSGIIGRINGTSTNNAFLGFASAGTNKWSIGNVQSDHRFRIYSEANTSELVSVLQTGEFGIGIANPTTKLHIDGGASALIANLDANVSVAKSVSFRSDNSARFNIEVSGTESGSNAGADLFVRRYSDAGALIDTPLTIVRSTGNISTTGSVGIGTSSLTGFNLYVLKNITGATNSYGISQGGTVQSGVTNSANGFLNNATTAAASFTLVTYRHFWANQGTIGAGSSITTQTAFEAGSTLIGATNNYGFRGLIPSGTNRWNLYMDGTAQNYFAGNVGIGVTTPAFPLEVYFNSSTAYTTSSRGNAMRVYNPNSGSNIFAGIELGGAGTANDGLAGLNAVVTGSGSAALTFYTRDSNTFLEKLRIAANGNIGIGTNNPITNLHIKGSTTSVIYAVGASNAYRAEYQVEAAGQFTGSFIANPSASSTYGGIGTSLIGITTSSTAFVIATSEVERMRITSGGYLKASNDGTYYNATESTHELRQTSIGNAGLRIIASNTGYYDAVEQIMCTRTNNSAYSLSTMYSNNFADAEFNLRGDGNGYADGSWSGGGADYAEFFEWLDGNPNNEDRRGYSVSLVGNKIKIAQKGETIIGVISGNPSVVGDSAWNIWTEKYLRDDFGTYVRDENGDRVLNPNYNPDIEYIPREQRPEWGIVGLMGKLCIRKGQEVMPNWVKMKDISDNVEQWLIK